jgi:DNA-binding MarR family transcriptional regulator
MAETGSEVAQRQLLPLLDHLARIGRRAAEASMAPGGLRPRHLVALTLLQDHGPAGQQSLADSLKLDPSNVVALLNELEERELVTRRRDPVDRRRHIVELSDAGARELACARARFGLVEDRLLAALTADERSTLYELLVRAVGSPTPACTEALVSSACAQALDEPSC